MRLRKATWLRLPHIHLRVRAAGPSASLAAISLVLGVLFVSFVSLLWAIGFFDFHKKAANAQIYAATLVLVGGFFATAFTFVAALLKHSIDVRTLGQARETEQRLRLETSIRAVELLTEDGKTASPSRQAGALFVLGSLGQLDFALALLAEVWPKRDISSAAAVWVVNRALMSDDEHTQKDAAILLASNAETLKDTAAESCWEWPSCFHYGWMNIAVLARENLLDALLKVLISKSKGEWDPSCIHTFLMDFNLIREFETTPHIRDGAVVAMDVLLGLDLYAHGGYMLDRGGKVGVEELRAQVSAQRSIIGGLGFFRPSLNALQAWVETGTAARAPAGPTLGATSSAPTLEAAREER
jgi:hypothetical protein